MSSFTQYIRETKSELNHVSWPTLRQTTWFTVLVIVISLLTAVYLGAFDQLFTHLVQEYILK